MTSLLMMGVLFVIMYFFFLRPTNKASERAKPISTWFEKGDEVVIASGIIGRLQKWMSTK